MPMNYRKLWSILSYRGMTKDELRIRAGLSWRTINVMTHCGDVNTSTITKICEALGCQPGDIMEYIPDDKI